MGYHIICPEVGDADMSGEFRVTAFVNVFDSTHVVLVDTHVMKEVLPWLRMQVQR